MATKKAARPPAPQVADSHDLIRVHGARVNNLKDVSIELPKRRLTVFTGVSGSGKSSLVFGTIAAESQRLINETYSAFVQGFMPTLSRPEVDVLEGLTTAIIVDQERMGSNPRSTVGTATDANAMLRILFSRLGKPHIGPPTAFSFNVPTRTASGAMTVDKGAGPADRRPQRRLPGRHVPALRGHGLGQRLRPVRAVRREQVARRGRAHDPRLQHGRLVRPHLQRLPASSTWTSRSASSPRRSCTTCSTSEPTKIKVEGINLTYEGVIPKIQKSMLSKDVDAMQPHVRAFVERAVTFTDLSRLRRHPAQRGGPVVEDRGEEHRRRLLDADQRPGRLGAGPRRAVGGPAARRAAAPPRLVRGDRAGLPLARPAVGHAVRAARRSAPR